MPPSGSGSSTSYSNGSADFHFNPRNAEDIFAEFFGSNPFGFRSTGHSRSTRYQSDGGPENVFRPYSDGGSGGALKKAPAVESKLACSLEELFNGSTRKMKISRNLTDAHGYIVFLS